MSETALFQMSIQEIGDEHLSSSVNTPLREDAFLMSDEEKIDIIAKHFKEIMNTIGLDLTDDRLKGTPDRVAKMYVQEIFGGLNQKNKPKMTVFENKYQYNEMIVEKDITLYSNCEHHFVPIIGKVHIAYISNGTVIGLSKLNRLVEYYASRPQVQERLTNQLIDGVKEALNTDDIAVVIDANHHCVASRGIKDSNSTTLTARYSGRFMEHERKYELFSLLNKIDLLPIYR